MLAVHWICMMSWKIWAETILYLTSLELAISQQYNQKNPLVLRCSKTFWGKHIIEIYIANCLHHLWVKTIEKIKILCLRHRHIKKKIIDVVMGPVSQHILKNASIFCQKDWLFLNFQSIFVLRQTLSMKIYFTDYCCMAA